MVLPMLKFWSESLDRARSYSSRHFLLSHGARGCPDPVANETLVCCVCCCCCWGTTGSIVTSGVVLLGGRVGGWLWGVETCTTGVWESDMTTSFMVKELERKKSQRVKALFIL